MAKTEKRLTSQEIGQQFEKAVADPALQRISRWRMANSAEKTDNAKLLKRLEETKEGFHRLFSGAIAKIGQTEK